MRLHGWSPFSLLSSEQTRKVWPRPHAHTLSKAWLLHFRHADRGLEKRLYEEKFRPNGQKKSELVILFLRQHSDHKSYSGGTGCVLYYLCYYVQNWCASQMSNKDSPPLLCCSADCVTLSEPAKAKAGRPCKAPGPPAGRNGTLSEGKKNPSLSHG